VTVAERVVVLAPEMGSGDAEAVVLLANGVIHVLLVQSFTKLAILTLPKPTASLYPAL
jgi:hypothetical protein